MDKTINIVHIKFKLIMKRSTMYFNALLKAPENRRMGILQAFPAFVIDDLIEIIYNVVLGNVEIGRKSVNLKKYQKTLLKLVDTKGKKTRRGIIYRQKGGFLGAILPIVMSVLGSML